MERSDFDMGNVSKYILRHPRAAAQMVRVGNKIWVIGGRSYINHFSKWGEDGFAPYMQLPNPEYFDLSGENCVYTQIETGKDFSNATAFTLRDGDTDIYLSCNNLLAKIDTAREELVLLGRTSISGTRLRGQPFRMEIRGKAYIVLVCGQSLHYFDPDCLDFVVPDGVLTKLPDASCGAAEYHGCLYLFGGSPGGDFSGSRRAWMFNPNAPMIEQLIELPKLPIPLEHVRCAVLGEDIYLFGGASSGDMSPFIFTYNLKAGKYGRKGDLPFPLFYHSALSIEGGSILVLCGYSMEKGERLGFRGHHPYVLRYEPLKDRMPHKLVKTMEVTVERQNVILSFGDADGIFGEHQSRSVTWQASPRDHRGELRYRAAGQERFTVVPARGRKYGAGMYLAQSFRAEMTDLSPDTEYEYQVCTYGETVRRSPLCRFRTYVSGCDEVRTVIFGDSKSGYEVCNEIAWCALQEMERWRAQGCPVFTIELGDFGAYGSYDEYGAWFNYAYDQGRIGTQKLVTQFPFIAVHGNHEYLRDTYFNLFQMPVRAMAGWPGLNNKGYEQRWFSYNYGPVHFIELTLGSYGGQDWYDCAQREWFRADLEYACSCKAGGEISWIIVITHQSFMTTGEHFHDIGECGQFFYEGGSSYMDIVEQFPDGVDVVYSSHDHDYERSHAIRGFRWIPDKGDGKPGYIRLPGANLVPAEPGGVLASGQGVVYIVTGGAGAGQRTMYPADQVGDASWIALRKTDPDIGECVECCPVYHYLTLRADRRQLDLECVEKDLSFLPGIVDDGRDGVIDRLTIKKSAVD